MNKKKAVFILWDEETADPKRVYISGGEGGIEWVNRRTVIKRARWSNTVTDEEIARAKSYAIEYMDDGRVNVRVEVLSD